MKPKLYTIGHSNKTIQELLNLLVKSGIEALVDVRSVPYSKYNPQFNREALRTQATARGIKYIYKGKNLGGKGINEDWQENIDLICDGAKAGRKLCVMCSEADPNNCHRQNTIQPDVEKQGIEVEHIIWESKIKKRNGKSKESRGVGNLQKSFF